jgi:hypothetical protein
MARRFGVALHDAAYPADHETDVEKNHDPDRDGTDRVDAAFSSRKAPPATTTSKNEEDDFGTVHGGRPLRLRCWRAANDLRHDRTPSPPARDFGIVAGARDGRRECPVLADDVDRAEDTRTVETRPLDAPEPVRPPETPQPPS